MTFYNPKTGRAVEGKIRRYDYRKWTIANPSGRGGGYANREQQILGTGILIEAISRFIKELPRGKKA